MFYNFFDNNNYMYMYMYTAILNYETCQKLLDIQYFKFNNKNNISILTFCYF